MHEFRIGTVSHVDFIPINKKPGFVEKFDQVMMSAFVYFSDPWLSSADDMYDFKSKKYMGNIQFWDTIAAGNANQINISEKEYWLCFKNKKPIQRTIMNIHQVVENGRYLEILVQEQSKKIEELERKLEYIQKAIVNQNTVRSEQNFWDEFKIM
jgi:23S rRNA A1618 N6-methylase RlmF